MVSGPGGRVIGAVLLAGPTASGKSAAALELASRFGGVVVNADSMQVYEELRVLTARPNLDEERLVPHRLYGVVPARRRYSVGHWLTDIAALLQDKTARGRLPIITGGTGLYFKALTEGLALMPEIPESVRQRWQERRARMTPQALHEVLAECDPEMAKRLSPSDPQRIIRALEVFEASGMSLARWQAGEAKPLISPARTLRIIVTPDRTALYAKINRRFDSMLELGAMEEVKALTALGLPSDLPAMRAHGVPELTAALRGEITHDEAIEKSKTVTRHYAKRQVTWARRFMTDWHWVETPAEAVMLAADHLAGSHG